MSHLAVVVHSFDKYAWLWPGYEKAWRTNWHLNYPETYLASDIETDNKLGNPFKMIYSGAGEWSDRLRRILLQLPYDYILYMQEDHWPTKKPPLHECWNLMEKYNLNRLQISTVNQFYSLTGDENMLFFHHTSKYLVSHQPSIWKKSFLLECLKPGETPWVNEYEGTKRLNNRPDIHNKIAIYPCDWYRHMCVKGKLIQNPTMLG
jgi:hypothetical protein